MLPVTLRISNGTSTTGDYSTEFISAIKANGRMISTLVLKGSSVYSETDINSCNIYWDASLFKSVMKCAEIEFNGILAFNIDDVITNIQVGVSEDTGNTFYYAQYGQFIVTEVHYDYEELTTKVTAYDVLINSMKPYELEITYSDSYTNANFLSAILTEIGVSGTLPSSTTYPVLAQIRNQETYNDSYTYRDVLDDFAEIMGTILYIDPATNTLTWASTGSTNSLGSDSDWFAQQLSTFTKTGSFETINRIVLSRSPQEDNVAYSASTDGEEIKFINNQLVEGYVDSSGTIDRTPYLQLIYAKCHSWDEFSTYEFDSYGYLLFQPGDILAINDSELGVNYGLYLSGNIQITQGIKESGETAAPESSETDYTKAATTSQQERDTYLYVDKVNQTITSYIGESDDHFSQIEQTVEGISLTVSEHTSEIVSLTPELIVGTHGTTATATWTGTSTQLSALTKGTHIQFQTTSAGASNVTLNLTLTDGSTTGAIPVYYTNTTRLSTQYGINSVISLVYDGSSWRVENPYTNTNYYDRTRYQSAIRASGTITSYHIICGTSSGYRNLGAGVEFDLGYPLLYALGTLSAPSTSTNNYLMYSNINYSTTGTIQSGVAAKILYLKGTVSGNTFTIASSNWLTTVIPSEVDNYYYMPLGVMSSATNGSFSSPVDLYAYVEISTKNADGTVTTTGAFQKISSASNTQTQLNTSRMSSLEVTVDGITATVSEHTTQIQTAQSTADTAQTTAEGAQSSADSAQSTADTANATANANAESIDDLQANITQVETTLQTQIQQNAESIALSATKTEVQSSVNSLNNAISGVQDDLSDIQTNVESVQISISSLQAAITALQNGIGKAFVVDTEGTKVYAVTNNTIDEGTYTLTDEYGNHFYVDSTQWGWATANGFGTIKLTIGQTYNSSATTMWQIYTDSNNRLIFSWHS